MRKGARIRDGIEPGLEEVGPKGQQYPAPRCIVRGGVAADFLETWLNPVAYAGAFVRMHALGRGRAGTFVAVEPRQSMTAAQRGMSGLRSAPGAEGVVALAMLKVIVDEGLHAKEA